MHLQVELTSVTNKENSASSNQLLRVDVLLVKTTMCEKWISGKNLSF